MDSLLDALLMRLPADGRRDSNRLSIGRSAPDMAPTFLCAHGCIALAHRRHPPTWVRGRYSRFHSVFLDCHGNLINGLTTLRTLCKHHEVSASTAPWICPICEVIAHFVWQCDTRVMTCLDQHLGHQLFDLHAHLRFPLPFLN
jgi:hypothetical protein